ncbi:hypothetical protein [Amycolatopsis solani]|uniref:hypothetical protein n=1 Tax=Amycolatopsis solani TaxID=3028615 RepID=UPI0025B0A302|nr:hypothetical protein [Amycolatopsis sp. MEP2-6]
MTNVREGRWRGAALMAGSGLANQVGASVAALAFPQLGPAGVVAVRQWVAAAVLLTAGRPRLRAFTAAWCWSGNAVRVSW